MFKANFKLYLKTLLASVKYALVVACTTGGSAILLQELLEGLPTAVSNAIVISFPSLVSCLISIKVRKDEDVFDAYVRATDNQKLTVWQDLKLLFRSKHFYLEVLAYGTYMLACFLFLLSFMGMATFNLTLIVLSAIFWAYFLIPNILSWVIVHAIFRKKM